MRALNALRWAAIAVLIAVLAVPALTVLLTGHTVVEVDGGSMEPTYKIGDVVTIREPRPSDFVPGTVVTATDSTGEKYTHRIVQVDRNSDLILRGDNNDVDDPAPVPQSAVIGVVDGHFEGGWATLVKQLQSWPLRICLLIMIVGLIFLPLVTAAPAAGRRAAEEEPRRRTRAPGPRRTGPTAPATAEEAPRDDKSEVLDLVDSMRSAVTRVLLSSDRRLSGTYAVSTKQGMSDFPSLRVVIDIAEKTPTAATPVVKAPAATVPVESTPAEPMRTRRELRASSVPRVAAPPVVDPEAFPTRRSRRHQTQHGRRRAR